MIPMVLFGLKTLVLLLPFGQVQGPWGFPCPVHWLSPFSCFWLNQASLLLEVTCGYCPGCMIAKLDAYHSFHLLSSATPSSSLRFLNLGNITHRA